MQIHSQSCSMLSTPTYRAPRQKRRSPNKKAKQLNCWALVYNNLGYYLLLFANLYFIVLSKKTPNNTTPIIAL